MKIVFAAWPSLIDAHLVDNVTNTTVCEKKIRRLEDTVSNRNRFPQ